MRQAVKVNGSERAGARTVAGQKAAGRARTRKRLKRISHLRRPEDMSLEQWQVTLRRQISREQGLRLKNVGSERIFSEFLVTNPKTKGEYRVAIRGQGLGENYCSCPDFAVNTLGTCKHIEFVLAKCRRVPGGKLALKRGFKPAYSEIFLRYGAKREVVFRPGTDCPAQVRKVAATYFNKHGLLTPDGYLGFERLIRDVSAWRHEVRCYEDTIAFVAEVRDQAHLRDRVEEAFPKGIHSAAFKDLVKATLYPYQREGALFAAKAGRSLIADDMGLGKTIQAIAAVEILARTAGVERVLVVCPTSLKHQWHQEISRFVDRSATVVEGFVARRTDLYKTNSFYKITNYEVVHRDLGMIAAWQPDVIILDEAQRIKNWKTRRAQAVKRLDSKYAIVLTGTPLENRLEELHSIVQFVDRFRLGPLFRFLNEHQHTDGHGKVIGYHHLTEISRSLEPILVRRTKGEVLKELPERMDKNYFVPMTDEQMRHHDENKEIVGSIVRKWQRMGFLTEADQRRLMIALQFMRMSCDSTYLIDQKTDHGVKADEFVSVINEVFERPETKVVVFSQWLRMHELLQDRLAGAGHKAVLFHGGVPGPQRKDLIRQFKEEPDRRVFLSTDAGGVGLNLQNASVVVNMDLPWNPAVLEQRIGRVHRLGQHRPVSVVNFVAQGTIEQGMLSVLAFKKSLFSGALDNGQDEVFLGGTRLQKFMEGVQEATAAIKQPMPTPAEAAQDTASADQQAPIEPEVAPPPQAKEASWDDLVTTGLSFLDRLSQALSDTPARTGKGPATPAMHVETDAQTGQSYLKLPLPAKDVLRGFAGLLTELAKRL